MRVNHRSRLVLLALGALLAQACGGSAGSSGGASQFSIVEVSNGFGRILPHEIALRDAEGNPTDQVVEVTNLDILKANLTQANQIRPPTKWPEEAQLPSNLVGNHFLYARFSQDVDVDSVLTPIASGADANGGTGAIQVQTFDPTDNSSTILKGRLFVGGRSYGPTPDPVNIGNLLLETWFTLNTSTGDLEAASIGGLLPGLGIPGTESGFAGDDLLADPRTVLFVVDEDGDFSTYETFPSGVQIQMKISGNVRATGGRRVADVGLASSTVGDDTSRPEVLSLLPAADEIDVDPDTNIELQFTEPIQILSLGDLDDGKPPPLSSAVQIEFGPPAARVKVPFFVRPFSVYDLSRLELVPAYNLPGSGPPLPGVDCGSFGDVTLTFVSDHFADLNGGTSTKDFQSTFITREGTGVVNAPVVPDVIYIGRGGANPGLSVVDLNGFGGSTGNPTYDQLRPIKEGNTNFPNNPNVGVLGTSLQPQLQQGSCTFNGGSEGPFTLTKDSSLNDLLARSPVLESVGDMSIGHALDNTFNNSTFGCQAGGGNICASTGLKVVQLASGGANSLAPSTTSALPVKIVFGGENLVSWAPSPNPPPLIFPPLCLSPLINAQEPTNGGGVNLLVPGANSRGNPGLNIPPTNLLAVSQNAFFNGPSAPQVDVRNCISYGIRQQIGHFLYVIDRVAAEVVVLNSNRFTVIDRIRTPDPTSFAMSPNMDLLAVTNESADQVTFIDTDPSSSTFHRIVRTVNVGVGPTGIAWEPGNEDIFVCNQTDGSVSVISAFSLRVRKTLRNQITRPIDVALTPRQLGIGFLRGVYFGYVLNQDGTCAVFESGPDGINGWGYDDTIGSLPFRFFQPKAIQPDIQRLNSAVWICHENPLSTGGEPTGTGGGALTNVGVSSGNRGIISISSGGVSNPSFRNLGFSVFTSVGEDRLGLSGIPVDLAFDNQVNVSAFTNFSTNFSAGQPLSINGKAIVRLNGFTPAPTSAPAFMFLAVPNPGVIDVLELSTGTVQRVDTNVFRPDIQSISAPNVTVLADFFRQ